MKVVNESVTDSSDVGGDNGVNVNPCQCWGWGGCASASAGDMFDEEMLSGYLHGSGTLCDDTSASTSTSTTKANAFNI